MYIEFDATQADYLDEIVPTFWSDEWMDTTMYDFTVPTSMMLPCRIRHFSPANGAEAFDYFYLHIYGSDETAADLCGYDSVSVADNTGFWQDRQYMVGPVAGEENKKYDGWKKSILIETTLEYPTDFEKECMEDIYRTLEL
jgi:hypothetical protein